MKNKLFKILILAMIILTIGSTNVYAGVLDDVWVTFVSWVTERLNNDAPPSEQAQHEHAEAMAQDQSLTEEQRKEWEKLAQETDRVAKMKEYLEENRSEMPEWQVKQWEHDIEVMEKMEKGDYSGLTENTPQAVVADVAEGAVETVSNTADFISDFTSNPIGTLVTAILDVFKTILGYWVQVIADMVQTLSMGTTSDFSLTYSYDELKAEDDNGPRNMYTNVKKYKEGGGKKWQKVIDIKKESGYDFSSDTPIPVTPVDLYNMAIGNIDFLDVNFLEVNNNNHAEGSIWLNLRNFISVIIHIVIYIVSGILLATLIWHGINLVKKSFGLPEKQKEHRDGLKRFFIALGILIGTIVIMALLINMSDILLADLQGKDTNELPIRVNVESAEYSFSTNITGYALYMSQIDNVDMFTVKAVWVVVFIAFAWLNLATVILLIARMIVMMLLAIVGVGLAAIYALDIGKSPKEKYKQWLELYASLALVQVFLAIASKIILENL